MKKFDVAVYYRLDTALANIIAKCCYSMHIMPGHRFQVACDATDDVMAFVKVNPEVIVADLTYNELTGHGLNMYRGKTRYVIIGVSLKMATLEDFQILTKSPYFYVQNVMDKWRNEEGNKTDNPNIFYINGNYYWHAELNISKPYMVGYNEVELEWLRLWEGFDHYYSYSDDISVYRRGKSREGEIHTKGEEMGISSDRRHAIYKQEFCKK